MGQRESYVGIVEEDVSETQERRSSKYMMVVTFAETLRIGSYGT